MRGPCEQRAAAVRAERGTDLASGEPGTRERVLRAILENGPTTAPALAVQLGLTQAAVRRHLDALLDAGHVASRAQASTRRSRGRPARVFVVTRTGRSTFHHTYDDLAVQALRFMARTGGSQAVLEFARWQVAELETRYRPLMTGPTVTDRARALADALSADGYAASSRPAPLGTGQQMCQHHCPVADVAAEFPQLCEAETEVIARLLGTHVQRLATIAHGDDVCTTHVPTRQPAGAAPPYRRSTSHAGTSRPSMHQQTAKG
jgi:predicted ArsR family transcriptional regulator